MSSDGSISLSGNLGEWKEQIPPPTTTTNKVSGSDKEEDHIYFHPLVPKLIFYPAGTQSQITTTPLPVPQYSESQWSLDKVLGKLGEWVS